MRADKVTAITLRKSGASYNEISKKLKIPKSTLSGWFHNITFSEKIRAKNVTKLKAVLAKNITDHNKKRSLIARERWAKIQIESRAQINNVSARELFLVGVALYWAEGYKRTNWNLAFSNSDPDMIRVVMKFFRSICNVPPEKFRVQMQLYSNLCEIKTKNYWSQITDIPVSQFTKAIYQISSASKLKRGRTLLNGTIRVRINDVQLVNKIKGWISGLSESI